MLCRLNEPSSSCETILNLGRRKIQISNTFGTHIVLYYSGLNMYWLFGATFAKVPNFEEKEAMILFAQKQKVRKLMA